MMNKTAKFWDKQADNYDTSESKFEPAFEIILYKTKNYLKNKYIVLDFGCATGTKTFELAPLVKKIHGIDISPKMIEGSIKKADELKIKNAIFSIGTIFDNSYKNESFDVIVSYGVIHLLKENDKVMKKIFDLLKPGGFFISTTACLKEKMTIRSKIEFSLYMFIKKIGLFPIYLNMYKVKDVEELVSSSNFKIVESEMLFHGITMSFIAAKKE